MLKIHSICKNYITSYINVSKFQLNFGIGKQNGIVWLKIALEKIEK